MKTFSITYDRPVRIWLRETVTVIARDKEEVELLCKQNGLTKYPTDKFEYLHETITEDSARRCLNNIISITEQ